MRSLFLVIAMFLSMLSFAQEEQHWETNFDEAKKVASSSEKFILMSFQGSDWCANCKRLERTLFQSEEFRKLASEKFVLLKLDFPARKENKLPKEQAAYNDEMAAKYNNTGSFPKVLVFDKEGNLKGEMSLASPMLDAYITSLKSLSN